jgi:hypothetical protein
MFPCVSACVHLRCNDCVDRCGCLRVILPEHLPEVTGQCNWRAKNIIAVQSLVGGTEWGTAYNHDISQGMCVSTQALIDDQTFQFDIQTCPFDETPLNLMLQPLDANILDSFLLLSFSPSGGCILTSHSLCACVTSSYLSASDATHPICLSVE